MNRKTFLKTCGAAIASIPFTDLPKTQKAEADTEPISRLGEGMVTIGLKPPLNPKPAEGDIFIYKNIFSSHHGQIYAYNGLKWIEVPGITQMSKPQSSPVLTKNHK